jgi:methyl-accepting chemotaxis protein
VLGKFKLKTVKMKLLVPLGMLGLLLVALLLGKNQMDARDNYFQNERHTLQAYAGQVQFLLAERARQALTMAQWLAATPAVQQSFEARDREKLKELLLPVYRACGEQLGLSQCQFAFPPATSFLRLGQPDKFGDDLSSFRHTFVQVNREKKPVMGLEAGRFGVFLRGVAPVFSEGRHVGAVEFGMDLNPQWLRAFKEQHGLDVVIFVSGEQGFRNLTGVQAIAGLEKQPLLKTVMESGRPEIMEDQQGDRSLLTYVAPLADYAGKNIGVLTVTEDITGNLAGLRRSLYLALALGAVLVLGMLVFVYITVNRLVSRPLQRNYQTLREIIKSGDLTRRVPMKPVPSQIAGQYGGMDFTHFGKKVTCWLEVGSNAPGAPTCKALLDGKYPACNHCPVAQIAINDEVDKLSGWINTFVKQLADIIQNISGNAGGLSAAAGDLDQLSGQMSAGAVDISARLQTVAAAAEEMSVNQNNVAAAMDQTSGNISMVAAAAEEMTATINEIAQRAEAGRGIAASAAQESEQANQRLVQLGQAAQEIDQITGVITDISEQINLLALNATIEAARAGEAGKGFAVVAQEVKSLAQQTAQATDEIKNRVEGIKNSTGSTVEEISRIIRVIGEINDSVAGIAAAVEQQSATTREIAQNVVNASQGVQQVSDNVSQGAQAADEVSRDLAHVNQEAGEITNGAQVVREQAHSLSGMAGQLQVMVGKFKF